ncbi:TIGR01459 family HAD-type hydrolase [Marivita geojedonensis]|uniref:HAD family hydrolase n=1 Tax=Marivita geojedonensis TaxID=1123756 RepID=A0A1X4NP90_9RHOB|nr:TIGR01459 family HAD-type hydrolase [Marivita geojedonensis]OSQ52573.1 HAD family hydrolase [Marivita geojedonensis]PRY80766.1 HAD superfamily hydrolase (TIGR01459 family) [Marivita geojedonensis]
MTQIISSLADIADRYDVLLVDLWGCVHNGVTAHEEAVAALRGFKQGGGTVVLLTNAPRSRHEVAKQLVRLNVPEDCYDSIATSGDSARAAMFRGAVGEKVWFMGLPFDETFFAPMELIDDPVNIQRVELEDADGIVCCGPFDPHADPAVNRPQFLYAKQKGLKLLCANPDIVVDRGEKREWCAGALAALYTEMGGESLYFGKPHPPIYDLARRRIAALGVDVEPNRILAIGDGIHTDIDGAMGEDIDSLFISGGLAASETKTSHQPDPEALSAYLAKENASPPYTIGQLR